MSYKIKEITENFKKSYIAGYEEVVLKQAKPTEGLLISEETFSVMDLVSEGPIAGLVDKNGIVHEQGEKILCGVYLDDVPVRETSYQDPNSFNSITIKNINNTTYSPSEVIDELSNYSNNFIVAVTTLEQEQKDFAAKLAQQNKLVNDTLMNLIDPSTINSTPTLFNTDEKYVKYLLVDYAQFVNNWQDLNISTRNRSIKVFFSGENGVGELKGRQLKDPDGDRVISINLPNPILNVALSFSNTNSAESDAIPTIKAGYFLLPLAINDSIIINESNEIIFNSVDTNCVDQASSKLQGAKVILLSETKDEDSVFNFDKISVNLLRGSQENENASLLGRTSRSVSTNFKLNGITNEDSFNDNLSAYALSKKLNQFSVLNNLVNQNNFISNGVFAGSSIYSKQSIEQVDADIAANEVGASSVVLANNVNYAEWAKLSIGNLNENRDIFEHVVQNNAVSDVSLIFTISKLYDTYVKENHVGTQVPAFLELGIVLGLEGDQNPDDPDYEQLLAKRQIYLIGIEGLVQSPFRFKIGEGSQNNNTFLAIQSLNSVNPFDVSYNLFLPQSIKNKNRYVKVYRITPETFSSKRGIEVSINAVNEHYPYKFKYPLSALVNTTLSSKSFSSLPSRTFDLKLKKILVPSNYNPINERGLDKRLISNALLYTNNNLIYDGDWDGTFKEIWSDNPAWIVYDLLVNPIYGIGASIESREDINIWELYKIGRYADAVDDDGYFIGVPDGYGGLEPRFSFNTIFNNEQEAFDMINSVAVAFRGSVFYNGSEIDFYYDRPDELIAIFNNKNVKDGSFSYSDTLKSSRYTIVEVPYLDKRDNYIQKVEYYEDEESISKYGYIKKTFEGIGITSRGQAQRFAKYALLSNKYETETVSFVAKEEGMFLSPGDIIRIDDELKNIDTAEGFILDVDTVNNKLITNYMDTSEFDTGIYVYKVTDETGVYEIFRNLQGQEVSLDVIDATNTSKINFYNVNQYIPTSTNDGGSALAIELSNGSGLEDVRVGSFFSIPKIGRNENLFKIISINDLGNGEFEISAQESEQRKYDLIDLDIRFSDEELYFENDNTNYNINDPQPPSNLVLSTGIVNSKFTISGAITRSNETPLADKFKVQLLDPNSNIIGNKEINYTANPTYVSFDNIQQFGNKTYEMRAYSVVSSPFQLISQGFATASITIPIVDEIDIYQKIRISNIVFTLGADGNFTHELFPGGIDSGNFKTYGKNMEFSLVLKDRFGLRIDNQQKIEQHWDNPLVSIDLLDASNNVKKENFRANLKQLNFQIVERDFETYYGEFPRDFKIQIRVTGDSQLVENIGTLIFENGPAKITEWAASSKYDGIGEGFQLFFDAEPKYRQDINELKIYYGTGREDFSLDEDNLLTIIRNPSQYLVNKFARMYRNDIYGYFINNKFYSVNSIKDSLFNQGEEIVFVGSLLPQSIEQSKYYQIILGKTINSEFYFDADYGYFNINSNSIQSLSYGYEGEINTNYIEINRLNQSDSLNHVGGGIGLMYPSEAGSDYLSIDTDTFFSGKFQGIKNQFSDGFIFKKAGMRIATSGVSSYPMQKEYEDATFAAYINPELVQGKQTIFDFGSPTGGCLLFVEQSAPLSLNYNYTFRAITKDQGNGTGQMVELTGSFFNFQLETLDTAIKHFAVSIQTIKRAILNTSSVRAYLYIDGEIKNFQEVSGWGINDHNHACGIGVMIGNSVNESANTLGNYFTGAMTDIVMYSNYFNYDDIKSLFLGTYNEYEFQISEGNRKILEIGPSNVPNDYAIYSTNKCFKIDFLEEIIDENGDSVDLYEKLKEKIPTTNQIIKEFSFANVKQNSLDELHNNIYQNPYYLSEIDFISENYVWQNFSYPQYKIRYLPNKPGSDLSSYDQAGALVLQTPNTNKEVNVTGVYVQEIGGVKYARLFLDEEYLGFRETGLSEEIPISNYDSLILKNLENLGVTSTECRFINYQNFTNVSTNILLTGTNSNTGYENFTGWNKVFQSSETEVVNGAEITLGKNYQIITDDSEEFYEGVWIAPQIPLQVENWYTASIFYKTDTNLDSGNGWNYRIILGNEDVTFGAIAGITIYPSGNILQEWKEPVLDWSDYFQYGDTGIITSGDWKRAYFNFKPLDFEDSPYYILKIAQLYLERTGGAATTGSGIFALPQIELATGINGLSPSQQQPTTWNSPEYPIDVDESSENEGFNDYKQLNVYPYNQDILADNLLVISQNTAIAKKTSEPFGLYTGVYAKSITGYIGGPNGERIEWSGNYKRYDNLFNDFVSITGYYPQGRWILYEGISLTGDGPVWGGWDIIAHYTGSDVNSKINFPENFDWSNDSKEIKKYLPIGGYFEKFNTDFALSIEDNERYAIEAKVLNTDLNYLDFNIKVKPIDIWGEGITVPSGINDPLGINYVKRNIESNEGELKELWDLAENNKNLIIELGNTIEQVILGSYTNSIDDELILEDGVITDTNPNNLNPDVIETNKILQPFIYLQNQISYLGGVYTWASYIRSSYQSFTPFTPNTNSRRVTLFYEDGAEDWPIEFFIVHPNQDQRIKVRYHYDFVSDTLNEYGGNNPLTKFLPWESANDGVISDGYKPENLDPNLRTTSYEQIQFPIRGWEGSSRNNGDPLKISDLIEIGKALNLYASCYVDGNEESSQPTTYTLITIDVQKER